MENNYLLESILIEIKAALEEGYLSIDQVQILNDPKDNNATYDQLIKKLKLSCKTVLVHLFMQNKQSCISDSSNVM